ncbi:MAG TPA: DUF2269 family protein [Thermoplasmata archaeon]|nr:DUF2269 family protein [Thermoplasmata archaeon]
MTGHASYILAEFVHVLFGMIWLGGGIVMLFVVIRVAEKDGKVASFKTAVAIGQRAGPMFMIASILVLATGIVYMGLKYGWDLGYIWSLPNGRLILIALVLVIFAIVLGAAGATPMIKKLAALKLPDDPDAMVPEEARSVVKKLKLDGYISLTIVTVVMFLMVAAANGGF